MAVTRVVQRVIWKGVYSMGMHTGQGWAPGHERDGLCGGRQLYLQDSVDRFQMDVPMVVQGEKLSKNHQN